MPWSALVALCVGAVAATYEDGQEVQVSMNKVWPFANPTETYRYYDFPFCQPKDTLPHFMTLGQILRGDRLMSSLYKINMKRDLPPTIICNRTTTVEEAKLLRSAIDADYMFELFVAELPVLRPFGVKSKHTSESSPRYLLINYLDFTVGYNEE